MVMPASGSNDHLEVVFHARLHVVKGCFWSAELNHTVNIFHGMGGDTLTTNGCDNVMPSLNGDGLDGLAHFSIAK